jgi:uncharacterized protein
MLPVAPHSPCISVCSIDPRGWCRGCYRTLGEIAGWVQLGRDAQWAVVRAADERRRLDVWPARERQLIRVHAVNPAHPVQRG